MAEKTYKTIIDQLGGGSILQSYGSKYLVSVNPAPSIHKVRWSIVELNTGGKVYSNFFMSMEQMRQLCDEIEKGIASKKLAADKESQYPSAYKYVTGENGSKKLNIGGGQKGIRVQIQENVDGKWDNKMSVISIADFVQMKFLFFLVTGLTLTKTNSYYSSLYDAFWKGEADRAKLHQKSFNDKEDSEYVEKATEENAAEKPVETSTIAEDNSKVASKPIVPENTKSEKVEEKKSDEYIEIKDFKVKVTTSLEDVNDKWFKLTAVDEINKPFIIWFSKKLADNKEAWERFKPIAEKVGSMITISGDLTKKGEDWHFITKKFA